MQKGQGHSFNMSCPRLAARDLFSVFVGHIPYEVTKAELLELFNGCGRVEDLFVVENQRSGSYNYGFVRFKKMENAVKAVKDLHRWSLRGTKLVVDLAKDTFLRIERGHINVDDLLVENKDDTASSGPATAMSGVNPGVKDVMYVSRVRETCVSLDMDARLRMSASPGSEGRMLTPLDVDCLMEDISKARRDRVFMRPETLPQEASVENVTEKLLLGTGEDLALGREKVKDFVSALQDVMDTINTFLNDHQLEEVGEEDNCTNDSATVRIKNEDSMLQENHQEHTSLSDVSPRTKMNGTIKDLSLMSLLALGNVPEPVASDGSISSSEDGDTGVLGGDSGVESDHKSPRGGAVHCDISPTLELQPGVESDHKSPRGGAVHGDIDPTPELQPDVMSEPKKPDILFSPVLQSYLARASLGRGSLRGYGRGTPPAVGYGRGMATPTLQGYGRGVGQMY